MAPLRITVWNEFRHEQQNPDVRRIYPDGIHQAIADGLTQELGDRIQVHCATLDQPDHGLTEDILAQTDVLFWWGHMAHDAVRDDVVDRIHQRCLAGMGLVALHSAHYSKIFTRLMGTTCSLRWREAGERERIWIVDPSHPIVNGLDCEWIDLPHAEMYGEFFDIPQPESLVLLSWFQGGEVFRSGCTFKRGKGKIFYFRPGHETYPIYYDAKIRKILANSAIWADPTGAVYHADSRHIPEFNT